MGLPGGNPVVARVFTLTLCLALGGGTLVGVLVVLHHLRYGFDP